MGRAMTITCADCGTAQVLPEVPPRSVAECHRCDRVLDRRAATSLGISFVTALLVLGLVPLAALLPFLQSTIRNLVFEESRLISSVAAIYREVWFPFAFGFLLFAIVFPALRALWLVVVLGSLRWGWRVRGLGRLFRWNQELRIWSMTDVVAAAGVATYFRAAVPADVEVLRGGWLYLVVALLVALSDLTLEQRPVWNAILADREVPPGADCVSCGVCEMTVEGGRVGAPCPRCAAELEADNRRWFVPTLIVMAAAVPLAFPAYEYAVMVNDRLTGLWEHTVLGTVELLAEQGLWVLGLVILVAGVVVPAVELAGLAWLLARVRFPTTRGLVGRTRAYRLLRSLVRWPMVIPFIAATAAPIVDFPGIDDILAGPGATPFFLLVGLLVLTVRLFEPRMMWQAAGAPA